nr:MAG TPA: hypothetical protein [Caudoviricetes sp.]
MPAFIPEVSYPLTSLIGSKIKVPSFINCSTTILLPSLLLKKFPI